MKIEGKHYRTIWVKENDEKTIQIIDQRNLPHEFIIKDLKTVEDVFKAIKEMHVRGAPLIGAAAGFGMYLATVKAEEEKDEKIIEESANKLISARPTAKDLEWAVKEQLNAMKKGKNLESKKEIALRNAKKISNESAEQCKKIGEFGVKIIEEISNKKNGETVNILTHCNAGWLACVDFGTATAPIYEAQKRGIKVHVWVDETRPRNQGARLTAWELLQQGIEHTIIVDNAGGHLMQKGLVDLVIVGTDRTTYTGDVANKIGTYLKALAAKDNEIPFYVALPSPSIDWEMKEGKEIPIEEREEKEVKYIRGLFEGKIREVLLPPKDSPAANFAFDITPARLITGLITERGICEASEKGIKELFSERDIEEIE